MIIRKDSKSKAIKSSKSEGRPVRVVKSSKEVVNSNDSKYSDSLKYVRSAIDCLSADSHDDAFAKEIIANLGVVALDISSKINK